MIVITLSPALLTVLLSISGRQNKLTVNHLFDNRPLPNRPFPSSPQPPFQSEAKCEVFAMKISFHSY